MRIINFTAVEILPKLLSKEKIQTIRPAWDKDKPFLKVGDQVQIMWDQRSKFKWFDRSDGAGVQSGKNIPDISDLFNKILGTAEITEVFKIEIGKNEYAFFIGGTDDYKNKGFIKQTFYADDLSKRDGFKSAADMFCWFDERYGLKAPRQFYVYRWRWL